MWGLGLNIYYFPLSSSKIGGGNQRRRRRRKGGGRLPDLMETLGISNIIII